MWSRLKNRENKCIRFLEQLEESASAETAGPNTEALLRSLPAQEQDHAIACKDCHTAVDDLLTARALLEELPSRAELPRPWFASGVMAAIAAYEAELNAALNIWVAVPKLASRLTWVSAVALLLATTWLFERPAPVPARQTIAGSTTETLFEISQPPATHDEVLASLMEKN
jgi:hypothetical protein